MSAFVIQVTKEMVTSANELKTIRRRHRTISNLQFAENALKMDFALKGFAFVVRVLLEMVMIVAPFAP